MRRRGFLWRIAGLAAASGWAARGAEPVSDARSLDVVPANARVGFHFPYILRTPAKPDPGFPFVLVEANNTGRVCARFEDHLGAALELSELLGRRMMPDRWRACERIYAGAGAPARFETYEKLGHGTNGLVHAQVAAFLRDAARALVPQ